MARVAGVLLEDVDEDVPDRDALAMDVDPFAEVAVGAAVKPLVGLRDLRLPVAKASLTTAGSGSAPLKSRSKSSVL